MDLALRRTMLRLGLRSLTDLFALGEHELREWLAYDAHRQQAIDTMIARLADPGKGKESILTPEAYAVLMTALLQ